MSINGETVAKFEGTQYNSRKAAMAPNNRMSARVCSIWSAEQMPGGDENSGTKDHFF